MNIIHTADWHLGNTMHDINRNEEVDSFFNQLSSYINENNAQTLIISGDVFDTINPSNEAKTKYMNFLGSLNNTCCRNVIITGGNHDSPTLLEAAKEVLEQLNIHVVGWVNNKNIEDLVFELYDSNHEVTGICCAVPYVREGELRNYLPEECEGVFSVDAAYKELYRLCFEYANKLRAGRNIPIIATGHLFASNLEGRYSKETDCSSVDDGVRDIVGNLGNVSAGVFGDGFSYVALGHIHYNTRVAKKDNVRYSGSPFTLGFDETKLERGILKVSFDGEKLKDCKFLTIEDEFQFVRFEGTCNEIKEQIASFKSKKPKEKVFAEICFKTEDGKNVHDELREILDQAPFTVVSWKLLTKSSYFYNQNMEGEEELKEISQEEIFKMFILSNLGLEKESDLPESEMKDFLNIFDWAVKELENEDSEN